MKFMIEAFETHNKLNPRLFNNSTMTMRNEVRERLLEIADKFVENLKENDVPLKVVDYWVVGSNAAYNYNDQSDIDVHIIVNMEDIDAPSNILTILYNYAKSDFNSDYDITIRGQEVELYIEDVNTSAVSNGIYSLKKNEWIKKPEPLKETSTDVTLDNLYKEWEDRFEVDIESDNVEQLQEFVDDLYILRKSSLMSEGEFGTGNLVFKELRNQGKLQQIKDKIKEVESKELTLESLNEKQEVTVYNALAAYPRYKEKYGKLDAFFELKYNFRLTPEECLFIINKVFEKGYIDEYTKDEAIKYLKLNEN